MFHVGDIVWYTDANHNYYHKPGVVVERYAKHRALRVRLLRKDGSVSPISFFGPEENFEYANLACWQSGLMQRS